MKEENFPIKNHLLNILRHFLLLVLLFIPRSFLWNKYKFPVCFSRISFSAENWLKGGRNKFPFHRHFFFVVSESKGGKIYVALDTIFWRWIFLENNVSQFLSPPRNKIFRCCIGKINEISLEYEQALKTS